MRLASLAFFLALSSCATIPEPPGGEVGLPTAGAGPFRALAVGELGQSRSAPNALTDSRGFARDIAVIDLDGKPDTYDVAGFVAASVKENGVDPEPDSPTRAIVRYGAIDARSFDRSAAVVLTPDASWEGGVVSGPAIVRVGTELFLYYAAAGGIGLARGDAQGTSFTKMDGPVLAPVTGGWEAGAVPRSPGVVRLDDGSFRLFYEVPLPNGGSAIGEAKSSDGSSFVRIGDAPVLSPASSASDAGDPPIDGASVGGPFPMLATSNVGEPILRVYYGAVDAAGKQTIGLAARYGVDGPLLRAAAPVYGTGKALQPREPCVVAFTGFALLFTTQQSSTTDEDPVIGAALAPATAALPPADVK
ncbi:Beta-galactosidase [Minicystis rosea]|nr:Beta-galactosidase [Minicystis rosea]